MLLENNLQEAQESNNPATERRKKEIKLTRQTAYYEMNEDQILLQFK
jgi:hypothetical protein